MSHPTPRHTTSSLVKIGNDDPTLTGHVGPLLTGELVRRLEVVRTIEEAVNRVRPFKQRQRGLNAGELMVSLAETVMVGGDHLVHLDQLRGDLAGAELRAVSAPPAPTTAGQLLKRFQAGQCQAVVAAMAELGNRFDRLKRNLFRGRSLIEAVVRPGSVVVIDELGQPEKLVPSSEAGQTLEGNGD